MVLSVVSDLVAAETFCLGMSYMVSGIEGRSSDHGRRSERGSDIGRYRLLAGEYITLRELVGPHFVNLSNLKLQSS